MVTQISAASPSPDFHSGKSYVKKNKKIIKKIIYFLAICVNIPYKIEKFELEVVGMDKIFLSVQPLTYLMGKWQLKE